MVQVVVISSEGAEFRVSKEVANKSRTLANIIEDCEEDAATGARYVFP